MVQVVVLSANGESRTLKTAAITGAATGAAVAKSVRKTKPAEAVGTYTWKGATLTVWGWKEGKAGMENKHELPPPLDKILLFSDAVVVSSAGDITVDEWSVFYDTAFGGFEETRSESGSESGSEGEEEEEEEAGEEEVEVEEEVEESESEAEEEEEPESEAEEEEEEEDENDDCYDDGEEGGGSKRRAPRRRAVTAPEYRRMEMGLRSRVKMPTPPGKRAPRWQTAPELEAEVYGS